jgi:hypothetical protein
VAWTTAGTTASGTASTLAVTNTTVGDVRVVWAGSSSGAPIASAGGVTTWHTAEAFTGTETGSHMYIAWGLVTSTGSQTVSMTNSPFETLSQQFVPPTGTVALDVAGTASGTTSAVVAGAALSPAAAGELWLGYGVAVGSTNAGNTTGVVYTETPTENCIGWNLSAPGTAGYAPNWTQSGHWDTIAALLTVSTGTALPLLADITHIAVGRASVY